MTTNNDEIREINDDSEVDERCAECGVKGSFYEGLCYQCQAELHSLGLFNMDKY